MSLGRSARIVLSDEEDEDIPMRYTSDGDNDDDDPITEPMSAEALELLQTEKVLKAGYLLKKGEKRRVSYCFYYHYESLKLTLYFILKIDLEEALVRSKNYKIGHV